METRKRAIIFPLAGSRHRSGGPGQASPRLFAGGGGNMAGGSFHRHETCVKQAPTHSQEAAMSLSESETQARLLAQALPFMQRYENKTIVVKYGGHAMGNAELGKAFASDIALLKQSGVNPIVVHGGGPQIGAMLSKMGIESKFEGGLRVTDQKTVEIVEMVLAGSINKEIVALINQTGEWAIGLCGKDGNMVFAEKAKKTVIDPDSNIERILDLGFVGEVVEVDRTLIDLLAKSEMIPVIAPVAPGRDGHTYNINADTFAGAIAGALNATRLLFLTDVPGVLDKNGQLIKELSVAEARALIKDGTISGGMIPKVETCIDAIKAGVQGVVILNGKTAHSVLLEIFTEHGAGTLLVP
jgi:acetylglutamate kinase